MLFCCLLRNIWIIWYDCKLNQCKKWSIASSLKIQDEMDILYILEITLDLDLVIKERLDVIHTYKKHAIESF